jgi:hypothetical protein
MPDADRSAWVTLESAAQTIAALASPAGDVVPWRAVRVRG